MATREDVIAELQRRGYKGQIPGGQPQAEQPDNSVGGLIKKFMPGRANIANAMSVMGGGKPIVDQTNSLDQEYKRAQIEALNRKGTGGGGYFYVDDQGQVHPVESPPGAKPLPAGSTPIGQGQKVVQTEATASTIPLNAARTELAGAQTEAAQTGNKMMEGVVMGENGQPGNVPPGTTMKAGPMTIPLNPPLNDSQAAAVSGVQALEPIIQRITEKINGGIFSDTKMGNIGRTVRQVTSGTKNALLTSNDPKLQSLQSDLNALKKTIPFTEGGKQLTPFEAEQVFALLNTTGKNDAQIINDLNQSMQILRSKEALALGGRNAALRIQQQLSPDAADQSNQEADPLGIL